MAPILVSMSSLDWHTFAAIIKVWARLIRQYKKRQEQVSRRRLGRLGATAGKLRDHSRMRPER